MTRTTRTFVELQLPGTPAKCDFCSAPPTTEAPLCWYQSVDIFYVPEQGPGAVSRGDWAACPNCAAFVEAGDAEGLAVRSYETLLPRNPHLRGQREAALRLLREVQAPFFAQQRRS